MLWPAQRLERVVFEISNGKHFIERLGEVQRDRPTDLHYQISPPRRHTVAVIFARNIETADKCDFPVANQNLPVVAHCDAIQSERVKPSKLATADFEFIPKAL